MDENFTVTDFDDRPITIGTRVRAWDYSPLPHAWSDHTGFSKHDGTTGPGYMYGAHPDYMTGKAKHYYGVVVDITDFDGDERDGRPVMIEPDVVVEFDDGVRESFRTSEWEISYGWYDRATGDGDHDTGAGKVEELVVVTERMIP